MPVASGSELNSPFDDEIGLVYTELGPDGAQAELPVRPSLLQPAGIVHGGVYCSIVESMASMSAHVWLASHGGGNVVGVNNNTDFLRATSLESLGASGRLYAESAPIHRGRSQQLWVVTISDDRHRVVARGQVRLQNLDPVS